MSAPKPDNRIQLLTGILLSITLILATLGNDLGTTLQNNNSINILFLFTVLAGLFAYRKQLRAQRIDTGWIILFSLTALSILTSTVRADLAIDPFPSRYRGHALALLFTIPMTWIVIQYLTGKLQKRLERWIGLIALCFWVIALGGYLQGYYQQSLVAPDAPFFRNLRHPGFLAAASIAPLLWLATQGQKATTRMAALLTAMLALSFIILSGSRGAAAAILGAGGLILVWMLLRRLPIKLPLATLTLTLIGTIVLSAAIQFTFMPESQHNLISRVEQYKPLLQRYLHQESTTKAHAPAEPGSTGAPVSHDASTPATPATPATLATLAPFKVDPPAVDPPRLQIWKHTLNSVLSEAPWFGLGPEAYRARLDKFWGVVQPHNTFLLFLLEWGIIGSLLINSVLLALVIKALKLIENEPRVGYRAIRLCGLHSFLALTILGMVDGVYYHSFSLFYLIFAAALMMLPTGQTATDA